MSSRELCVLLPTLMLLFPVTVQAQWTDHKPLPNYGVDKRSPGPSRVFVYTKGRLSGAPLILNSTADSSVTDIEMQSADIWLATNDGADHSSNLGGSWTHYDSGSGLGSGSVCGLSVSNSLIAVASSFYEETSSSSVPTGSGVSFSTNSGELWSHVDQPVDESADSIVSYGINDSVWIRPILSPEDNLSYGIDQQGNTVWIASFAGGIRESTDRGQHWKRILLPLDAMNSISPTDTLWTTDPVTNRKTYRRFDLSQNLNLLAFSVAVENDSTIWCGTAAGINRSTDGGLSWTRYTAQANGLTGNFVVALHVQKEASGNILWASTLIASDPSERDGISFTSDHGITWHTALLNKQSERISSYNDTVMVATDHGLFRSADGLSWQYFQPLVNDTLSDAVKDTLGRIWIASDHGLWVFNDNEASWMAESATNIPSIDSVIAPDTLLRPSSGVVPCSPKVYVSDPQGVGDISSVWFESLKPDGQFAGGGSKFFLVDQGNGFFTQTFTVDSSAQLGTYRWIFFAEDQSGNISDSVVHSLVVIDTTPVSVRNTKTIPTEFRLYQNFPNPFNPSTMIAYDLAKPSRARLAVYDMLGQMVSVLVDETKAAGHYTVVFDGSRLSSSVYFYQLQTGTYCETKKLVLLK